MAPVEWSSVIELQRKARALQDASNFKRASEKFEMAATAAAALVPDAADCLVVQYLNLNACLVLAPYTLHLVRASAMAEKAGDKSAAAT